MKKTLLIILLFTNSFAFFAQEIYEKPVVDERVELMSTVFRLAGAEEYVTNNVQLYVNEIDKYFEKYKNHSLIEYTKKLREKYDIGYDGVAQFAIFLEIKKGMIKLCQNIDLQELDKRWNRDNIPKYLNLLNDFYKKTKYHDFFVKNEKIRQIAEANFAKEVTDKIDFGWFKNFFGYLPEKKFRIIISLANGASHYGPKIVYKDGKEEFFAIIGSWQADESGYPNYENKMGLTRRVVVHELSHSFCNPLVFEYIDKLLPKAIIFYNFNKEKFNRMAYDRPESFWYEIFVRACEIQYRSEHPYEYHDVEYELTQEINNGFLLIPQLFEAFKIYKQDSAIYKTLRDFMPIIVNMQDTLNPQKLYDEIENKRPVILGTSIANECDTVDFNLDSVVIYFDKPMYEGAYGATTKENENYPDFVDTKWVSDKEWVFYFKLEPDTTYAMVFPEQFFMSKNSYYKAKNTYTLTFKTRKK